MKWHKYSEEKPSPLVMEEKDLREIAAASFGRFSLCAGNSVPESFAGASGATVLSSAGCGVNLWTGAVAFLSSAQALISFARFPMTESSR